MTLTIIQINNLELITSLTTAADEELLIYCHDKKTELSYSENLPMDQFMQRIRQLNKRVHFPIKTVRTTVSSGNPMDATFGVCESAEEEVKQESAEQQAEKVMRTVLCLKYRIEGAPAPLKWEWHLTAMDSALFYRTLLKDTLNATSFLKENLNLLLDVIRKKDIELKQYRIEGTQLRRTTVATEPFDVPAFQTQHKQMLMNVDNYGQVEQLLNNSSTVKNEVVIESPKSTEVPTTIPGNSDKLISPRSRKRKAMESGIQHVERKALQRRLAQQLQYKNSQSQSQESDLEDEVLKTEATVKTEDDLELTEIGCNINADMTDTKVKVEPSSKDDEFNEIMKIIISSAEQSN